MASFNSMLFLTLLVAISALMAAPSTVKAGLDENEVLNVTGTVPCALIPTYSRNGTLLNSTFPNATVELRCGKNDTVVGSNTTNANGTFSITRNIPPSESGLIAYLRTAKNCSAVVTTPLSACNRNFTVNGTLRSELSLGPIEKIGKTKFYHLLAKLFGFYLP